MSSLKRLARVSLFTLIAIMLAATPVLAYTYYATLSVTETSSVNYSMLPLTVNAKNQWMADNGFMGTTALDTRVTTLAGAAKPHTVAADRTNFAIPVPANSQTNLYFTTGNSDLSSMHIVPGYNGFVTTLDHADLELGNDGDIYLTDCYANNDTIFSKSNAITLIHSGTVATAIVFGTSTTITQNVTGANQTLYTGSNQRAGQRIDTFTGYITSVSFWLSKVGNPVGTGYARVRKVSDDSIIGTLGTLDVSTLGVGATQETFTTPVNVTGNIDIRVVFEWAGGDVGNHVLTYYNAPGTVAGLLTTFNSVSVWVDSAGGDSTFSITYWSTAMVSHACLVGERDFIVSMDTINLTLSVDGASSSVALGGISMPNNANDWIWLSNGSPYCGQIQLYQGANYRINYAPNAIISGTILPNRQVVGSYNGAFTWGANPAGVAVSLGELVSTGQPSVGTPLDESTHDVMPDIAVSDWFQDPAVGGSLLTNPARSFVLLLSDNSTLNEIQAWRFLALVFIMLVTASTAKAVRGHLIITGVAAGASIGAMVAMTIFPMWALIFAVGAVVGGLIAERAPSL